MLAGCGWLPADSPPKAPAAPALDLVELVHRWTIKQHVLMTSTALTDGDAAAMTGRTVEVTEAAYTSPWQGNCEDAGRQRRTRVSADVEAELGFDAAGRTVATTFGLDGKLAEYRLTCNATTRTPPLVMYIAGEHAMTCFSGVCYLLQR